MKAAGKLREIGKENQIPIWGTEYVDEIEEFQDHKHRIQRQYWNKSRINVEGVRTGWPRMVSCTFKLRTIQSTQSIAKLRLSTAA